MNSATRLAFLTMLLVSVAPACGDSDTGSDGDSGVLVIDDDVGPSDAADLGGTDASGEEDDGGDDPEVCPESVDDCEADACEALRFATGAGACGGRCVAFVEDRCIDGDGCCPPGCSADHDDDCDTATAALGEGGEDSRDCPDAPDAPAVCLHAGWETEPGGVCSQRCDSGESCPDGWWCNDGLCARECSNDSQCLEPRFCARWSNDEPLHCMYLPYHPNGRLPGGRCTRHQECRGFNVAYPGLCMTEEEWGYPGGYCTKYAQECGPDVCFDGTVCLARRCWDECADDAECRSGYECVDHFDSGATICMPAGGGRIGDACEDVSDCLGSRWAPECLDEYPGGYCTTPCERNSDCPTGSHCSSRNRCVPDCSSDADCRSGYVCASRGDTPTCLPVTSGSKSVGEPCSSDADCDGSGGAGGCFETFHPDGYCVTFGCSDDSDCPAGAGCADSVCFATCADDADCRAGYVCEDVDGTRICRPGGTGDGATAERCESHADCEDWCLSESDVPNLPGGYCSTRCGASPSACGDGEHCGGMGAAAYCLRSCQSDADCARTDHVCRDADFDGRRECTVGGLTDADTGARCEYAWHCSGPNALCLTPQAGLYPAGYCTGTCSTNADCPGDGVCLSDRNSQYNWCWDRCDTTTDCRVGYECVPVSPTISVCFG